MQTRSCPSTSTSTSNRPPPTYLQGELRVLLDVDLHVVHLALVLLQHAREDGLEDAAGPGWFVGVLGGLGVKFVICFFGGRGGCLAVLVPVVSH